MQHLNNALQPSATPELDDAKPLAISGRTLDKLRQTAPLVTTIAVVMFVMAGLVALTALLSLAAGTFSFGRLLGNAISIAIYLTCALSLHAASRALRRATAGNDVARGDLLEAFVSLTRFFNVTGVMLILSAFVTGVMLLWLVIQL